MHQYVVYFDIVRLRIVGVQGQNAPLQLVHYIAAGVAHYHALCKAVRQLAGAVHYIVKVVELAPCGQIAHEQQVRHLLKAEGVRLSVGFHYFGKLYSPVIQLARGRYALAVLHKIPLHAAYLGHAYQHAGAVAVAQAPLYIALIELLID